MPGERTICEAARYWAAHLGCPLENLFAQPLQVVTHSAALADYDGVFALFRGGAAIVSFPSAYVESMRPRLPSPPFTPAEFAGVFSNSDFVIIGPAFIGYADIVHPPSYPVRSLTDRDAPASEALRAACTETEWEHGGSSVGGHPLSGVFVGRKLVALAGYEVWGGTLAHISVVTHPAFRGQGFGQSAVAHLAGVAMAAGLVPQYQTLESNRASIRIAESLSFSLYATSVAVRLNRPA